MFAKKIRQQMIRGILFSLFLIVGCKYQPAPDYGKNEMLSQSDNILTFEAVGNEQTCDVPKVFIPYGTSWAEIKPPADEQGFYIDDEYTKLFIGWCEPSECKSIDGPISVPLYKYVPVGLRETTDSSTGSPKKVIAYQRMPIHGKIKITFNIYMDGCTESIPIEYIIDN